MRRRRRECYFMRSLLLALSIEITLYVVVCILLRDIVPSVIPKSGPGCHNSSVCRITITVNLARMISMAALQQSMHPKHSPSPILSYLLNEPGLIVTPGGSLSGSFDFLLDFEPRPLSKSTSEPDKVEGPRLTGRSLESSCLDRRRLSVITAGPRLLGLSLGCSRLDIRRVSVVATGLDSTGRSRGCSCFDSRRVSAIAAGSGLVGCCLGRSCFDMRRLSFVAMGSGLMTRFFEPSYFGVWLTLVMASCLGFLRGSLEPSCFGM